MQENISNQNEKTDDEYFEGESNKSGNEYLTFYLAEEEYGVDILRVKEIRGWEPVSRIPNAPEYVKGVLNLRGAIVPIVDLRTRFGLSNNEYTSLTVVVVLTVMSEDESRERVMGVVVDAISDVVEADVEGIQSMPDFDSSVEMQYISGLVSANNSMIMLINIDKMLDINNFS